MLASTLLVPLVTLLPSLTLAHQGNYRRDCPAEGVERSEDDVTSLSGLRAARRHTQEDESESDAVHNIAVNASELPFVQVTGTHFTFKNFTGNPSAGPFNKNCPFKGCGGFVWATDGGPGHFAEALRNLDPNGGSYGGTTVFERLDGESVAGRAERGENTEFAAVWFHILPNSTHPWHVHELMDEFVTVMDGSGVLDIMDPESQRIFSVPCEEGHVLSLPMGFLHMFRASSQGLHLLAYGNVLGATLALVPTFMAVLPDPLRETVLGKQTSRAVADSWTWSGNPASGDVFVCEANSDSVQALIDSGGYQECSFDVSGRRRKKEGYTAAQDEEPTCKIKKLQTKRTTLSDTFITFSNLNGPGAECIAGGAWCDILDKSLNYAYVKLTLKPRELLVGLMPSGTMIGFSSGKAWIAFYHPNNAFLLQFQVHKSDLFYIPPNVYVMFLSLEDTKKVKLTMGIQAKYQTQRAIRYDRMRIVPLAAALQQMDEVLAAAAFFPSLSKKKQEAATAASPVLDKPDQEFAPLVYSLSDKAYSSMKSSIESWTSDYILCSKWNSFCRCKTEDCANPNPARNQCEAPAAAEAAEKGSTSKGSLISSPSALLEKQEKLALKAFVEENRELKRQSLDLARRNEALEQTLQEVLGRLDRLEQSASKTTA